MPRSRGCTPEARREPQTEPKPPYRQLEDAGAVVHFDSSDGAIRSADFQSSIRQYHRARENFLKEGHRKDGTDAEVRGVRCILVPRPRSTVSPEIVARRDDSTADRGWCGKKESVATCSSHPRNQRNPVHWCGPPRPATDLDSAEPAQSAAQNDSGFGATANSLRRTEKRAVRFKPLLPLRKSSRLAQLLRIVMLMRAAAINFSTLLARLPTSLVADRSRGGRGVRSGRDRPEPLGRLVQ